MRSVGRVPEESLPAYSPPRRGGALGMTASPLPKIDFPLIIVQGGRFMVIGDRIRALREAKRLSAGERQWGSSGKDASTLATFRRLLSRLEESDRRLLLQIAHKMAKR